MDLTELINSNKVINHSKRDISNDYLKLGVAYSEIKAFEDSVKALSEAIRLNPQNKEAYLERAFSYFELGNFNQSIKDFLSSEYKSPTLDSSFQSNIDYAQGFIRGAALGSKDAAIEYIPSLLHSIYGLGNAIWSFASHPIDFSSEMIAACQACAEYIKNHSNQEILSKIVPELQELAVNDAEIKEDRKGEIIGYVISKYGIEIFAASGVAKCMKLYRELRRANYIMTLQSLSSSEANAKVILNEACKRWEIRNHFLKQANLKIQWDKQGKHIKGHRNFEEGRSILTHTSPEKLIEDFAGSGRGSNGKIAGMAGYREVVDFQETIGYWVNGKVKGAKPIATTKGKIHYAKDGIHIVPAKPD